ncbi:MAG: archaeosortase/exosortase family protein [Magnetococcales bacterium]|nr:archaeosortase/exosortase family protein [Magnetococcales bacterium]
MNYSSDPHGHRLSRRLLVGILVAEVLAFWPVWLWYARRLLADPEGWGSLMALLAAAATLFRVEPDDRHPATDPLMWASWAVLLYAMGFLFLPPLLHMILAVAALGITLHTGLAGRLPSWPFWGLLLLVSPLIPSLQFYLGFPMRWVSAAVAALLLNLQGWPVQHQGVSLVWGPHMLPFDAPCSGVRMLWSGLLVTWFLCGWQRASALRTAAMTGLCLVLVLLGNGLRGASLFHVEGSPIPWPPWVHEGVGWVVFLGITMILAIVALRRP